MIAGEVQEPSTDSVIKCVKQQDEHLVTEMLEEAMIL